MQKSRWYSAAEPTGEGNIVIIGGFVNGGYVNRNYPNVDPEYEGGAAEPTYEYYPPTGATPQVFQLSGTDIRSQCLCSHLLDAFRKAPRSSKHFDWYVFE